MQGCEPDGSHQEKKMQTERRLALDMGLYAQAFDPRRRLASDLSALVLETSPDPDKRVTPYTMMETPNGRVICPEFGDSDICDGLRYETQPDVLEARAALKIRDFILSSVKDDFLIVWISPPDEELGYSEGRIEAGFGREENGLKVVQTYGLCTQFSLEEHLILARHFLSFSDDQQGISIETADQLRETPIFINSTEIDFLDLASEIIPLPDVWEKIRNGEAEILQKRALEVAHQVAKEINWKLVERGEFWDRVKVGAFAERRMQELLGWGMRSSSGCGVLNSELSAFAHSHTHINAQGAISVETQKGAFVRKCPYCGTVINRVINAGYTCSCGKKYLGVC